MEAFVGRIRRKKFQIPRVMLVRERKMLISAKFQILCSEKYHIFTVCKPSLVRDKKKNNPLLLLMLIRRDLSLKEAFYDLHYF